MITLQFFFLSARYLYAIARSPRQASNRLLAFKFKYGKRLHPFAAGDMASLVIAKSCAHNIKSKR